MLANERQNRICEMIQSQGALTTASLVKLFSVSLETVRRDLLYLEQEGKLKRVHGGAVIKNDMKPFKALGERNKEFSEQKRELSVKATEFISEGDIIAIDSGSTANIFADTLKERFSALTVVTHSVDVFEALRNHKNFSVILCGGFYLREENAFCGELAIEMLSGLHIKKAFIFPSAISLEFGICDFQKELYQIQKQLIRSSDEIFILADSSKFEKTGLLKINDMKTEYTYVTDSSIHGEILNIYKENGIKIY